MCNGETPSNVKDDVAVCQQPATSRTVTPAVDATEPEPVRRLDGSEADVVAFGCSCSELEAADEACRQCILKTDRNNLSLRCWLSPSTANMLKSHSEELGCSRQTSLGTSSTGLVSEVESSSTDDQETGEPELQLRIKNTFLEVILPPSGAQSQKRSQSLPHAYSKSMDEVDDIVSQARSAPLGDDDSPMVRMQSGSSSSFSLGSGDASCRVPVARAPQVIPAWTNAQPVQTHTPTQQQPSEQQQQQQQVQQQRRQQQLQRKRLQQHQHPVQQQQQQQQQPQQLAQQSQQEAQQQAFQLQGQPQPQFEHQMPRQGQKEALPHFQPPMQQMQQPPFPQSMMQQAVPQPAQQTTPAMWQPMQQHPMQQQQQMQRMQQQQQQQQQLQMQSIPQPQQQQQQMQEPLSSQQPLQMQLHMEPRMQQQQQQTMQQTQPQALQDTAPPQQRQQQQQQQQQQDQQQQQPQQQQEPAVDYYAWQADRRSLEADGCKVRRQAPSASDRSARNLIADTCRASMEHRCSLIWCLARKDGTSSMLVQKAMEIVGNELKEAKELQDKKAVTRATTCAQALLTSLHGHVKTAVEHPHANFVMQKAAEVFPGEHLSFMAHELRGKANWASQHRFGCRVIMRMVPLCESNQAAAQLVDELLLHTEELAVNAFGNYVLQEVLEFGLLHHRRALVAALCKSMVVVSGNQYGVRVLEKALRWCDAKEVNALARALLGDSKHVEELIVSGSRITSLLRTLSVELQRTPQGRRILKSWESRQMLHSCCYY